MTYTTKYNNNDSNNNGWIVDYLSLNNHSFISFRWTIDNISNWNNIRKKIAQVTYTGIFFFAILVIY